MSDDVTFIRGKPQAALPQPRGRLPVAWPSPGREMIVLGNLLVASPGPQQSARSSPLLRSKGSTSDEQASAARRRLTKPQVR